MAETDFGYIITQDDAAVPNVFQVGLGSGLTLIDATGALAPAVVPLDVDVGIYLVAKDGATVAQLTAACGAYAAARGYNARPSVTTADAITLADTALAEGTWTPDE